MRALRDTSYDVMSGIGSFPSSSAHLDPAAAFDCSILRLAANLSCLYYLSSSFRKRVTSWVLSDSCFMSFVGVTLDPHFGRTQDEEE